MAANRADALRYLADLRAFWSAYHNHKETSAWAGVALYVVFLSQVLGARPDVLADLSVRVTLAIAVAVVATVVWIYIRVQFRLRRLAANYVAAVLSLAADHLQKQNDEVDSTIFRIASRPKNPHHQSEYSLPDVIRQKAEDAGRTGGRARAALETTGYAILLVGTALAGVRLWLAPG